MIFKMFRLKMTILALSVLALSTSASAFAGHDFVKPAQANYQNESVVIPVVDQPITFFTKNFRTNVEVNADRSVFEVKVPGLYSLDAFLVLNIPDIGDTVSGYITINDRKILTFFNSETRTDGPIVNFHFEDRLVYLERGDRVSVILSEFTPGTTILSSGFVMVALNNSSDCSRDCSRTPVLR